MPSVFMSYSREDLTTVQRLEQGLAANGVSVWRDQEKIYGGQKWPKILGEAIADRDNFLLAWSKNSSASHFAEFEWTTAIALKKHIVPCLLDTTPLPPSLAATNALPVGNLLKIVAALTAAAPPEDVERRTEVVRKLDEITATKPEEVVTSARTIFDQRNWTVQGDVYQPGGDINITNVTSPIGETRKTWLEKWGLMAGVAVSILTVLALIPQVRKEWLELLGPPNELTVERHLGGFIQEEGSNRDLADVKVTVTSPEFSKSEKTDKGGHFIFRDLPARTNARVRLKAEKEGYVDHVEENLELGDSNLRFAMKNKGSP